VPERYNLLAGVGFAILMGVGITLAALVIG